MAKISLQKQLNEANASLKKSQADNEKLKADLQKLQAVNIANEKLQNQYQTLWQAHEELKNRMEEMHKTPNYQEFTERVLTDVQKYNSTEKSIIINTLLSFIYEDIKEQENVKTKELKEVRYSRERILRFMKDLEEDKL